MKFRPGEYSELKKVGWIALGDRLDVILMARGRSCSVEWWVEGQEGRSAGDQSCSPAFMPSPDVIHKTTGFALQQQVNLYVL